MIKNIWFLLFFYSFFLATSAYAKDLQTEDHSADKKTSQQHEPSKKMGAYRGAKTATHPKWFKESFLDLEEDINDASEKNKRLVVYFWQPGCPYCSQLWEDNFSQKDIEDKFRENFEIVAINMWGDREIVSIKGEDYSEKSFAEALNIKYTPTLLFFDEKQKVTLQLNGYIPPEDFRLALSYASDKKQSKNSYAEYVSARQQAKSKDSEDQSQSSKLNDQDFFSKPGYNLDRSQKRNSDSAQQQKDKYLAVYFEKTNCKNCDLLHKKTLQIPLTRKLAKQFEAIQLDRYSSTPVVTPAGNQSNAREWANSLNISYLPAIIFFNPEGKEVMRVDAQMRSFHIQSVFDYVLSGSYESHPNFQRYISARADELREKGVDVDIWAY